MKDNINVFGEINADTIVVYFKADLADVPPFMCSPFEDGWFWSSWFWLLKAARCGHARAPSFFTILRRLAAPCFKIWLELDKCLFLHFQK